MKFSFYLLFLISFVSIEAISQTDHICQIPYINYDKSTYSIKIDTVQHDQIVEWIDSMYLSLGLNNSILIMPCDNKRCKNNATASMDLDGNRFIKYDSIWMHKLFKINTSIAYKVILSHEIGHHLSAHTLSLNFFEYENAVKYCDTNRKTYNKKWCNQELKIQYDKYLSKSRKQELEADRFCGYLSYYMAISEEDVISVFRSFSSNNDDIKSTHPKLSKRIKAIKEGYNLAKLKSASNELATLYEIKNYKSKFELNENYDIRRNKIMRRLLTHIQMNSSNKVTQQANIPISGISGPEFNNNALNKYITTKNLKDEYHYKTETLFWHKFNFGIFYTDLPEVIYMPKIAALIEKNNLNIISFEDNYKRIIYKATLEEINYEEIELLIVEMLDNGLKKSYRKYKG